MRAIRASLVILFLLLAVYPANAQEFDFEDNFSKGNAAFDSGQYELAIKYLEPCEKIISQDTTKEAQEIDISLLAVMTLSHAQLGKYKIAIDLCTRALDIQKRLFGESSSGYAFWLNNLASYYSKLGDYSRAVELATQTMEICKQIFGETSSDYATSLDILALNCSYIGDCKKAIELGTHAMEIRKQVFGETSSDYATSLSNLAMSYCHLGDYTKAVELGTQVLGI